MRDKGGVDELDFEYRSSQGTMMVSNVSMYSYQETYQNRRAITDKMCRGFVVAESKTKVLR